MLILTIRTDKPEAELGFYNNRRQLVYETWTAHRELAETIHYKVDEVLRKAGKRLEEVQGIIIYKGPGSFTGLRIGMALANALAYSLAIPITATGEDWIEQGLRKLLAGESEPLAMPEYGSEVYATTPRK